jgi:hypothetical protein
MSDRHKQTRQPRKGVVPSNFTNLSKERSAIAVVIDRDTRLRNHNQKDDSPGDYAPDC